MPLAEPLLFLPKCALSSLFSPQCVWTLIFEIAQVRVLEATITMQSPVLTPPPRCFRVAFWNHLQGIPMTHLPRITARVVQLGSPCFWLLLSALNGQSALGRLLDDALAPLMDVFLFIVKSVIYWIRWPCWAPLPWLSPSLTLLRPSFTSPDAELLSALRFQLPGVHTSLSAVWI